MLVACLLSFSGGGLVGGVLAYRLGWDARSDRQ